MIAAHPTLNSSCLHFQYRCPDFEARIFMRFPGRLLSSSVDKISVVPIRVFDLSVCEVYDIWQASYSRACLAA